MIFFFYTGFKYKDYTKIGSGLCLFSGLSLNQCSPENWLAWLAGVSCVHPFLTLLLRDNVSW